MIDERVRKNFYGNNINNADDNYSLRLSKNILSMLKIFLKITSSIRRLLQLNSQNRLSQIGMLKISVVRIIFNLLRLMSRLKSFVKVGLTLLQWFTTNKVKIVSALTCQLQCLLLIQLSSTANAR